MRTEIEPHHDPFAHLDARLNRFVQRAEGIRVHHQNVGVLQVGEAALQEIFEGSLQRFHDRSAAQQMPLHRLLELHGRRLAFIGLDDKRIRAAIGAYEVNLRLPGHLAGRLSPGHLNNLAALPAPALAELAERALRDHWTTRETSGRVAAYRSEHGLKGHGGPKPKPAAVRQGAALQRAAADLAQLAEGGGLDRLAVGDRVALRRALAEVGEVVDRVLAALR